MRVLLVAGVSMLWCAFLVHGPAEETVEDLENLKTDDSTVQFNCCVGLCICLHSGSALYYTCCLGTQSQEKDFFYSGEAERGEEGGAEGGKGYERRGSCRWEGRHLPSG